MRMLTASDIGSVFILEIIVDNHTMNFSLPVRSCDSGATKWVAFRRLESPRQPLRSNGLPKGHIFS